MRARFILLSSAFVLISTLASLAWIDVNPSIIQQLAQKSSNSANANIPPYELQALQDFYDSTSGDQWIWLNTSSDGSQWNFVEGANPCVERWQGLNCTVSTSNGVHINGIQLREYNLQGSIPRSFGVLSELQVFDLNKNFVNGTLPSELGNLTKLDYINLGFNAFSGPILGWIGNLTQLTTLQLYGSAFTGWLPSALGNLHMLRMLDIGMTLI